MSKKEYLYEIAESHYVKDMMTVEDIAKKLGVSKATIRNWMRDGSWVEQRANTIKETNSLLKQNRKIAYKIGENILKLLENNKDVPATMLNAYSRLSSDLTKIKEFEDSEKEETLNDNPKALTEKTLHALEQTFG